MENDSQQLLTLLRHDLHKQPRLSGQEDDTARLVQTFLAQHAPADELVAQLGGAGFVAIYGGRKDVSEEEKKAGVAVLLRCELDALPIEEDSGLVPYASEVPGVSHKCGHDGHMAMLCGVALQAHRYREAASGWFSKPGNSLLLAFQPAEETGAGAIAMLEDERMPAFDHAYSLHNTPDFALGRVMVKPGPTCCASRGAIFRLTGTPSHASQPENGVSPRRAMAQLLLDLPELPAALDGYALVTVVHARLGRVVFGTAPGDAVVMATLRTETDEEMDALIDAAVSRAKAVAAEDGLELEVEWSDVFPATVNDADAAQLVLDCCKDAHMLDSAFRWSEDFGHFLQRAPGAMFMLGAEQPKTHAHLHNDFYDFPDDVIPFGVAAFAAILDAKLS